MIRTAPVLAALLLLAIALTAVPVPLRAAAPEAATTGTVNEIASFSVPSLTKIMAMRMAKALASQPGLVKAVPVLPKKQLDIEFVAPTTNPQALLTVLAKLDAAAKLQGVRPAGAEAGAKSKCGGCPLKGVCGGSQKH